MVLAAVLERAGLPGKAAGIPEKGLAVNRQMEVDDEEEVLELDKKPGWERGRDADALFEWGDFR